MITITNALSLKMLPGWRQQPFFSLDPGEEVPLYMVATSIKVQPITLDKARQLVRSGEEVRSAIGHPDTAAAVSDMLGIEVAEDRIDAKLDDENLILVAQLEGPRLPAGATTLPEGASILWFVAQIGDDTEITGL